ncbi:FKBP-type peptidyl-prolyl cis-trans isomerase [Sphingomicrobium astaxanthinifaciens]|uniref:FKBP-type peptidyl-prolyl cis-trans isomerase n=1 Tax=Sphingomicrobium astaxanthinifaciens TaxID=1227949 RepID=UPI001FCBBA2C|nr:FKBP-type peptidyl-prolyl cis-trans isomerase [Sphingomicrobium astaxanthinifaciens]MCJ7421008.1 FKBP-type peptidyl-prolyl cis-trans isomerase [Sphingomicrobium astaxanthinifaciens]
MSASQVPLRPIAKGSVAKFWIAIVALVVLGVAVAWAATRPLQAEMTESGVSIRTLVEGEGETIDIVDGAFVNYTGSLADGRVFDSSDGRPVPMLPAQTVAGFSEALQAMRSGGSYKVRIPAELAYGDTPPPGSIIPAGADLYFDIEIVDVVRGAALMLQQQQPPQALPPEAVEPEAPAAE